MYVRCLQYVFFSVLVSTARCFMVKLVDGSFASWSFERRAPSDGLPIILKNHNDLSYLTTVLMGTPYQSVEMAPSLSMSFVAVATPPFGVSSNTYYSQTSSSSYIQRNEQASIPTLSGGSVGVRFAMENCALNGINSQSFVYTAAIALTNSTIAEEVYPVGARGVLGYGINPPSTVLPPNASLIPSFLPANFTSAVCGIELNHIDDPVPNGIFTMGALDTTAFSGEFTNMQVQADTLTSWSIQVDSFQSESSGTTQSSPGILASVDLYHSDIQMTTSAASQLYGVIPGAQPLTGTTWAIPCNSKFQLALTLAGKSFKISERDTIKKLSNGTCQGAVTGGAETGGTQLIGKIGAPFMRNYYTQFGVQKFTNGSASVFVGFATKSVRAAPASTVTSVLVSPTTVTTGPSSTSATSGTFPRRLSPWESLICVTLTISTIFML